MGFAPVQLFSEEWQMKRDKENVIKAVSLLIAAAMLALTYYLYARTNESSDEFPRKSVTTTVYDKTLPPEGIAAGSEAVYPMDINKASAEQLMGVNGIGGITAGRIIDYRNEKGKIHDIAELVEIDGIGDELCGLIAEYFYVDEADYIMYTAPVKETSAKVTTTKASASRTAKTTTTKAAETVSTTKKASFPIDINRVTRDELMQIDGIGEGMADKIIALRSSKGRITDMEQLLEIYGIGEDRLNLLSGYLFVSEADYSKASTTTTAAATVTTTTARVTTSKTTTRAATATTARTVTETEPALQEQRRVNINEADADEIAEALVIDKEAAEMIVWLRERIHGYSNIYEVLYLEDYDKRYNEDFFNSIKDYIYI